MLQILIAFSLTLALTASALSAETGQLNKEQIAKALFGNAMTGEYPNGQSWSETFNTDGSTSYREGGVTLRGRMTQRARLLCFSYSQDSGLVGGCFEIWRRSTNCFDFYGTKGRATDQTAATEAQKRLSQAWSARAWYSDAKSTCVAEMIS